MKFLVRDQAWYCPFHGGNSGLGNGVENLRQRCNSRKNLVVERCLGSFRKQNQIHVVHEMMKRQLGKYKQS